jgi:hypothetical protein
MTRKRAEQIAERIIVACGIALMPWHWRSVWRGLVREHRLRKHNVTIQTERARWN